MGEQDIFGNATKSEIRVKLFCDESVTKDWLYTGILVVAEEEEKDLISELLNSRCGSPDPKKVKNWNGCEENCRFHKMNDREVHFTGLNSDKEMYFIAKRWLDYLLCGNNKLRFFVQGIDRRKIDLGNFGSDNKVDSNVYNRFFRASVMYALKRFFGSYEKIVISDIYHDNSSALENHKYFSWHSLYKIQKEVNGIITNAKHINFIDSHHKKSSNMYSHLIQMIDLITGSVKEVFEAESTGNNNDKVKIAKQIVPLVDRIINKPWNKKSRYNYFGRCDISFFPKTIKSDLEKDYGALSKFKNNFYKVRPLKLSAKNQMEFNF